MLLELLIHVLSELDFLSSSSMFQSRQKLRVCVMLHQTLIWLSAKFDSSFLVTAGRGPEFWMDELPKHLHIAV
jgi:hypothetical protein